MESRDARGQREASPPPENSWWRLESASRRHKKPPLIPPPCPPPATLNSAHLLGPWEDWRPLGFQKDAPTFGKKAELCEWPGLVSLCNKTQLGSLTWGPLCNMPAAHCSSPTAHHSYACYPSVTKWWVRPDGFRVSQTWVQILSLPLTSYVSTDKSLNFPKGPAKEGIKIVPMWLDCWGLHETRYIRHIPGTLALYAFSKR